MNINNHELIGDTIEQSPSPNTGGKFKEGNLRYIIIHFTAGANRKSSVRSLTKKDRVVSAHVVIGRDGITSQLVPFDTVAYHAGKSEWDGTKYLNKYSIGIEIDNAGRLDKKGDEYYTYFNAKIEPENVVKGIHRNETEETYWHKYTDEQIATTKKLCQDLMELYPITQILGHEEISPGRKTDPGPAFPLDDFRVEKINS
jgi:N-acetylmuramoyl-L-alanine amidase